jgi:hypothetical protein
MDNGKKNFILSLGENPVLFFNGKLLNIVSRVQPNFHEKWNKIG